MTDKHKHFYKLGWQILEYKCHYYYFDSPIVEDHVYDLIEKEYDALAKELGEEPSASDMVGFKQERPSCQQVLHKIRTQMNGKI